MPSVTIETKEGKFRAEGGKTYPYDATVSASGSSLGRTRKDATNWAARNAEKQLAECIDGQSREDMEDTIGGLRKAWAQTSDEGKALRLKVRRLQAEVRKLKKAAEGEVTP